MAKIKKTKAPKKEYIPEGMKREDYADAAFRKKVTIIMGCILLVFVIGVVGVLGYTWWKTEQYNKNFEEAEARFIAEKDAVLKALDEIEAKSDNFDDKAQVKIELTDENFSDWVSALDATYNTTEDDPAYAQFGGASIKLQGKFITREFNITKEYWVYRDHDHDADIFGTHDHAQEDEAEHTDGEVNIAEIVPIEVIFLDSDQEIPEDGTWVEVTGVVGPSSTKSLSAVRYAEIKVIDEPAHEHAE